jgi:hypothetical protein
VSTALVCTVPPLLAALPRSEDPEADTARPLRGPGARYPPRTPPHTAPGPEASQATKAQLATLHALFSHGPTSSFRLIPEQWPTFSGLESSRSSSSSGSSGVSSPGKGSTSSSDTSLNLQHISPDIVAILIDLVM